MNIRERDSHVSAVLILHRYWSRDYFYRGVIVSERSDAMPNTTLNRNREPRDRIAREQEGDQIDRMNTADVVRCPDLVYIRRRVGQTADVPAGHHQPWLTTPCMELRSRDYRVSRPEARSADHLEAELNFASRTMYDFRMQKGYRAMPIRIDQTVDKDILWHMSSAVVRDGSFHVSKKCLKY